MTYSPIRTFDFDFPTVRARRFAAEGCAAIVAGQQDVVEPLVGNAGVVRPLGYSCPGEMEKSRALTTAGVVTKFKSPEGPPASPSL